jgi:hypothetical protein
MKIRQFGLIAAKPGNSRHFAARARSSQPLPAVKAIYAHARLPHFHMGSDYTGV